MVKKPAVVRIVLKRVVAHLIMRKIPPRKDLIDRILVLMFEKGIRRSHIIKNCGISRQRLNEVLDGNGSYHEIFKVEEYIDGFRKR
jgi:hypothetical protein